MNFPWVVAFKFQDLGWVPLAISQKYRGQEWVARLHSAKHSGTTFPSHLAALGVPKYYFDVAKIYRRRWLEESGQRLKNVEQKPI